LVARVDEDDEQAELAADGLEEGDVARCHVASSRSDWMNASLAATCGTERLSSRRLARSTISSIWAGRLRLPSSSAIWRATMRRSKSRASGLPSAFSEGSWDEGLAEVDEVEGLEVVPAVAGGEAADESASAGARRSFRGASP
jgi:hypothetical protein